MDISVSNVSFGSKFAKQKAARLAKKEAERIDAINKNLDDYLGKRRSYAELFEKALRETTANLAHKSRDMSLNEILKYMPKY